MNRAPYLFAIRVAAIGCALAVSVWFVDLANTALRIRGVALLPKVPPPEFDLLLSAEGRVMVMGDSVIRFVPPHERGSPSLFELLAKETNVPLTDGSWPGRTIDMYAAMTASIARSGVRPRALVVEVNLRHFSPGCEAIPNLQAPSLAPMLESGSFLPLRAAAVFKYRFGSNTLDEFLATPLRVGGETIARVRDLRPRPYFPDSDQSSAEVGRLGALTTCAFDFEQSKWRTRLDQTLQSSVAQDIPCIAFITPVDVEVIRSLVSDAEFGRVERNLETLRTAVRRSGVNMVDLSTALTTRQFDHVGAGPNEHLAESGRRIVAARVGEALRRALR